MEKDDVMRLLSAVAKVTAAWAQMADANPKADMLISPLLCRTLDDLRATMDYLIKLDELRL